MENGGGRTQSQGQVAPFCSGDLAPNRCGVDIPLAFLPDVPVRNVIIEYEPFQVYSDRLLDVYSIASVATIARRAD